MRVSRNSGPSQIIWLSYRAAYSGSVCGRGLSENPVSTLGFERRFNAACAIDTEGAFVEHMLPHIPPRPPQTDAIRSRNLGVSVPASSVGS